MGCKPSLADRSRHRRTEIVTGDRGRHSPAEPVALRGRWLLAYNAAGLQRRVKRAFSVRNISNGVIHCTPTALQASGILIRRLACGSGVSWVTTMYRSVNA